MAKSYSPLNSGPYISLYVTFLEKSVVGADLSGFWFSELVVVLELEIPVLAARMNLSHVSTWVFLSVFLINSFLVYRGLVRAVVLASYCSKLSSSYSALSVCTSTTILLDLAQMFLKLEVTVHLLGNVFVSVLFPVVEPLRSGACSHLVSLPHNVGLDDLDSVVPIVNDNLGHDVLSCLGSLHNLGSLVDQLVHVGFLGQAPRLSGACWRRGRWPRRIFPR
jgi:hypothetical protein